MATSSKSMTSSEFAKAAGLSSATVGKLIRDGKLKARKEAGKWLIPSNQLESKAVRELKKAPKPAAPKKPSAPTSARPAPQPVAAPVAPASPPAAAQPTPAPVAAPAPEKSFSIAEFSAMTYLTEKGVAEWLKLGKLAGVRAGNGEWRVLESNLKAPGISRLVRK